MNNEKNEKRKPGRFPPLPPFPPRPFFGSPFMSLYAPVVPVVYDGQLTILEQIAKLHYYTNRLHELIENNHADIENLGSRVDTLAAAVEQINARLENVPDFVLVTFDTLADPITADKTFAEIVAAYNDNSIIIGRASGDKNFYVVTSATSSSALFIAPFANGNASITMRMDSITVSTTTYVNTDYVNTAVNNTLTEANAYSDAAASAAANAALISAKTYADNAAGSAAASALNAAKTYTNEKIAEVINLISEIAETIPEVMCVNFDTLSQPITADKTFNEILSAYQNNVIVIARTNGDRNTYLLDNGTAAALLFIAPSANGNVAITMRADSITQEITTYITTTGGNISGVLKLANQPTENDDATNKGYVDSAISNAARYVVGEETKIGEWIENDIVYDVYRKIVDFGELPNAGQKAIAHDIINITRFISARAFASSGTNNLEIPMTSADGTNNIYLGVGNARISIITASDRSNFTMCYVELKFIRPQPVQAADIDG